MSVSLVALTTYPSASVELVVQLTVIVEPVLLTSVRGEGENPETYNIIENTARNNFIPFTVK